MERAHAEAAEANNTLPNGDIAYVGHGSSIALQNDQIVINGKPDQMYGEDVVADIRRFMREQGISYREGMTFIAAWCHAGVDPGNGWGSIAQYISNELKWTVIAPTSNLWIDSNGATSIHPKLPTGLPNTEVNGQWQTFRPGGR